MKTTLEAYIRDAAFQAWRWGEMDCCFWAGNWIRDATGLDPLEQYRGQYRSAREAATLIRDRGGLIPMVSVEMERVGLLVTTEPDSGDIAVVSAPTGHPEAISGHSVVIRSGPWWLARGLNGCFGFDATPLKAWRVLA